MSNDVRDQIEQHVNTMTTKILNQLARNTTLLPKDRSELVIEGDILPLQDIVTTLLFGASDCNATLANDPTSTWNDKRLSRAVLTSCFLSALALVQGLEKGPAKI
jgi:hypothetical protein